MPYKANKLEGKHVLVIGGSSGIGYAVAEAVLAHGAHVYIASSSESRVQQAVKSLGGNTKGHVVDVNSDEAVSELVKWVSSETQGNGLDHFVYTAGDSLPVSDLLSTSVDDAKKSMDTRYWGLVRCVKSVYPLLKDKGREASITWTSGTAALRPPQGWALVGGVTGAMEATTRSFAVDLAPVRVNVVIPGAVITPLWDSFSGDKRAEVMEHYSKKCLTQKVAEADDVADAYLAFLNCNYLTGTSLVVDGGSLLSQ